MRLKSGDVSRIIQDHSDDSIISRTDRRIANICRTISECCGLGGIEVAVAVGIDEGFFFIVRLPTIVSVADSTRIP